MQDQGKRLIIAVALALGVLLLWQKLFPSKEEPKPAGAGSGSGALVVGSSANKPTSLVGYDGDAPAASAQTITLKFPDFAAEFTNIDGALSSWHLSDARYVGDLTKGQLVADQPDLALGFTKSSTFKLPRHAVWTGTQLDDHRVQYKLSTEALDITKTFEVVPDSYLVRLTVGITGSRGLIGNELAFFLSAGGHAVVRLVRGPVEPAAFDDGTTSRTWTPDAPLDPATLAGLDAVVHLAGESIADGRWTAAKKARIRDSRTGPTSRLAAAVVAAGVPVFLSASAVGVYGDRGDEVLTEASPPGHGFLADVGQGWEGPTRLAADAGARVVNLRIGVVQTPRGGALAKQAPAFRAKQGAVLGPGTQWVSWITLNDLIGGVHHALMTESLRGPVNLTAPHPVTNRDYGRTLAAVLGGPLLWTAPAPALRLMFGEMADAVLLSSTRVLPDRLTEAGFAFDHPELEPALRSVLGR